MKKPLVSIIISNYNYARFLRDAVDSALGQDYDNIEVIVVDDGSTDTSRQILEGYGSRLITIYKENGGQASAMNAGVRISSGDILCFLDSDDYFYPGKVSAVVRAVEGAEREGGDGLIVVGHVLDLVTGAREATAHETPPVIESTKEEVIQTIARTGGLPFGSMTSSGISVTSVVAKAVFPLPELDMKLCADAFISYSGRVVADVLSMDKPLAAYRIHGENGFYYCSEDPRTREHYVAMNRHLNQLLVPTGLTIDCLHSSYYSYPFFLFHASRPAAFAYAVRLVFRHRSFEAGYIALLQVFRVIGLFRIARRIKRAVRQGKFWPWLSKVRGQR